MKKLIILFILLFAIGLPAQFANQRSSNEANSAKTSEVQKDAKSKNHKSMLEKNTEYQRKLRTDLTRNMRDFKKDQNKKFLFIALGLAFLYGIAHSMGPGHGKIFMVSQVIGSNVKYLTIVGASFLFAFLHSLSGLTLVAILKLLSMSLLQDSTTFSILAQNISYGIIILLGLWILFKALFSKKNTQHTHADRNLFVTALSIGFVPCPGSIIIAVFAMKMGTYFVGVMMVLTMALGMALTLIAINSLTLFVKSLTTSMLISEKHITKISKVLTIIGALLIIGLGTLFLVANLR
ncbi:MAG: hypothetical protein WC155_00465 [Candidatus Cloacimonadales bacterium]